MVLAGDHRCVYGANPKTYKGETELNLYFGSDDKIENKKRRNKVDTKLKPKLEKSNTNYETAQEHAKP